MATHPDSQQTGVRISIDDSLGTKLLPFVLSMTAGSADVIGFLGLGGLFIAHITGNLVILAARLVAGEQAPVAHLISVPVFMVALILTRLLAAGLDRHRFPPTPALPAIAPALYLFRHLHFFRPTCSS